MADANLGKLTASLGVDASGLKRAEGEMMSFAGKAQGIFMKLGYIIGGAFAVNKIFDFLGVSANLAGELEGVKIAFEKLNKPDLLDDLQKATAHTVNNLELMKSAVQAKNFQIPLDQLSKLLAFANKRAQDTGQSVDYLVQSIIMGIGRKSPLILDNLGISAIRLKEKIKGVSEETATVGDVATAVGEIIDEEMSGMGEILETSAVKAQQLNAQLENTQFLIGEKLNPALNELRNYGMKFLEGLAMTFFGDKIIYDQAQRKLEVFIASLKGLDTIDAGGAITRYWQKLEKDLIPLQQQLDAMGKSYGVFRKKEWIEKHNALTEEIKITQELIGLLKVYDPTKIPGADPETPPKINNTVAALEAMVQKMEELEQIAPAFYRSSDFVKVETAPEQKEDLRTNIADLTEEQIKDIQSWGTALDPFYDQLYKKNKKVGQSFLQCTTAAEMFAKEVMNISGSVDSLEEFVNAVRDAARQTIAAAIAEAVAVNVGKAVGKSSTWWGAIIAGAAAAAATTALFNQVIPSYAKGGLTHGEQLAMVGDNPSGVEAIIPSESWNKMGTNVNIQGIVHGKDLYWVMKNYQTHLDKTT